MGTIWLDGRTSGYPSLKAVIPASLNPQWWDGWEHRSRSSGGFTKLLGNIDHHTASGSSVSFQSDWSYCAVGHQDAPVANMVIGRKGEVGIHAAGASNHAGKGAPWTCSKGVVPLDSGNSHLFGIEVSNNGTGEVWSDATQDAYTTVVAALADAYGWDLRERGQWNTDTIAHFEYVEPSCPGRKIDPWGPSRFTGGQNTIWNMNSFRAECRSKQGGSQPPDSSGELMLHLVAVNGANAKFVGMFDDKKFGHIVTWVQNEAKYKQYEQLGARKRTLNMDELAGLWLMGPLPVGDNLKPTPWTGGEFNGHIQ